MQPSQTLMSSHVDSKSPAGLEPSTALSAGRNCCSRKINSLYL
jgi:hypothetical protein